MATSVPGMKFSLIPRKSRREIHDYIFREGVIVVKKDPKLMEHPELKGIPNLHVMMVLRSLKSHNFVTEAFNWQHHYYILTNEGIEHLRGILHLPSHVAPATHNRKSRPARREDRQGEDGDRRRGGGRGRRNNDEGFSRGGFGRDEGYSGAQPVAAA